MSKGAYLGVDGIARKVRKIYVGVDGVARKVKKGYIGVNGIAHKFFGGELRYYGTPATLSHVSLLPVGSANSEYALFALVGWTIPNGMQYQSVGNAFNKQFTRSELEIPWTVREGRGLATQKHAFFAGGYANNGGNVKTVIPYDTSLTQKTAADLLQGNVKTPAGAVVGDYALFGGSENYVDSTIWRKVSVYHSTTLTQSEASLTRTLFNVKGADNGTYAVFAGGGYKTSNGSSSATPSRTAVGFDESLTRVTATDLNSTTKPTLAVRAGDYAVFIGSSRSDAYDKNLTKVSGSALSLTRSSVTAVTLDQYGLCAGGRVPRSGKVSEYYTDVVDVYDASLTRQTITNLSLGRLPAGAVLGDYALFAGGKYYKTGTLVSTDTDVIDVYTVD